MTSPKFIVKRENRSINDALFTRDLINIRTILINGGIVLLPSDTCYSLAALATSKDVYKKINSILGRKDEPMSISFPNISNVDKYIAPHPCCTVLLERYTPGPITIVCSVATKVETRYTDDVVRSRDGTIGVRIPDSYIEREVANCAKYPITSVAVRNKEHQVIQDLNEAIDHVSNGISKMNESIDWVAIEGNTFLPTHSTVVKINYKMNSVELIREGVLPFADIQKASKSYPISYIEDWT